MNQSMRPFIKKLLNLVGEVFLLSLMLATIFINALVLADAFNALTSGTWHATQAVVLSADGNIQHTRWTSYINITYQYSVNDQLYTGERICFFELFGCSRPLLEKAEVYRMGDVVPIFYSPILPQAAVLFRDKPPAGGWLGSLCALPVVWLGSLFTFLPGWLVFRSRVVQIKAKIVEPLRK